MNIIFGILIYLLIGFALEWSLSDKFDIWLMLIWPIMLVGCLGLLIVEQIERKRK